MKLLLSLLLTIVIVISVFKTENHTEGLCGNYSFTYGRVKNLLNNSDVSGIISTYNMNLQKDLLSSC